MQPSDGAIDQGRSDEEILETGEEPMAASVNVEQLIKELHYEDRMYRHLLALAYEKADILIKGKALQLPELTKKEEEIIEQTEKLAKVREQLIARIAGEWGEDAGALNVSAICRKLPKEDSLRMSAIQSTLRKTVKDLMLRNQINRSLLENAIHYCTFSLQLMTQPAAATPQYSRFGQEAAYGGPVRSVINVRS